MQNDANVRNTRQQILDTAASWFRRKGLAFTSMTDLSKSIGIKTSSIYYHFPSKDALIEETFRIGIELVHSQVREAVETLGDDATYMDRLSAAIAAHVNALLGENDFSPANILNFSHATPEVREKNSEVRAEYGRYWGGLLKAAQEHGELAKGIDLSIVRMLLIGAMNWIPEWYDPGRKSKAEIARSLSLMVRGLAPPGDGKRRKA